MKIREVKALVDALPKLIIPELLTPNTLEQLNISEGKITLHNEVFNTELPDPNKFVCMDVEKLAEFLYGVENITSIIWEDFGNHSKVREFYIDRAKAISQAKVLQYKKGGE